MLYTHESMSLHFGRHRVENNIVGVSLHESNDPGLYATFLPV